MRHHASPDQASGSPSRDAASPDAVHYLVVVHGIGVQRPWETALPLIEMTHLARPPRLPDHVPPLGLELATLRSLVDADHGWVTQSAVRELVDDAMGLHSTHCPGELVWVDFHWADHLRTHGARATKEKSVTTQTETWAAQLEARLAARGPSPPHDESDAAARGAELRNRQLALDRLSVGVLREFVWWLRRTILWRFPTIDRTAFFDYLADVQLYATHWPTRAAAVASFHGRMAALAASHREVFGEREARVHVIAHSLGSVLAFDGLVSAAAATRGTPSSAAPGALRAAVRRADARWVDDVVSFVTLGSPLDKFVTLWPEHFDWPAGPRGVPSDVRIRHLNFSEEQDPVGDNFVHLRSGDRAVADWYRSLFARSPESEVYARSAVPGGAHLAYFGDRAMWARVLTDAGILDAEADPNHPLGVSASGFTPNPAGVHRWILTLSYGAPLVVALALLLGPLVAAAFFGGGWLWALTTVFAVPLGLRIMRLSIWVRQIGRVAASGTTAKGEAANERRARRFRRTLMAVSLVPWMLCGALIALLWSEVLGDGNGTIPVDTAALWTVGLGAAVLTIEWLARRTARSRSIRDLYGSRTFWRGLSPRYSGWGSVGRWFKDLSPLIGLGGGVAMGVGLIPLVPIAESGWGSGVLAWGPSISAAVGMMCTYQVLTLAEFRAAVQESKAVRAELHALEELVG